MPRVGWMQTCCRRDHDLRIERSMNNCRSRQLLCKRSLLRRAIHRKGQATITRHSDRAALTRLDTHLLLIRRDDSGDSVLFGTCNSFHRPATTTLGRNLRRATRSKDVSVFASAADLGISLFRRTTTRSRTYPRPGRRHRARPARHRQSLIAQQLCDQQDANHHDSSIQFRLSKTHYGFEMLA